MGTPNKLTPEQKAEAFAMREAGHTLVAVASKFNVSFSSISRLKEPKHLKQRRIRINNSMPGPMTRQEKSTVQERAQILRDAFQIATRARAMGLWRIK